MLLADTHLLGPFKGHWLDKLYREWHMRRAFQTSVWLHQPDVILFLGDVFDEGQWVDQDQFAAYLLRFQQLFHTPSHIKVYSAVGNHDIGFHYRCDHHCHIKYFFAIIKFSYQMSSFQIASVRRGAFQKCVQQKQ